MHDRSSGPGVTTAPSRPAPLFPDRMVGGLIRSCGALSTALILCVFVQIVVAVTRRYLFDRPLQWSDELIGYALVAIVMLGAGEALRRGDHIAIDLAAANLRGRAARAQAAVSCLAVIAFAGVLGVSIWDSIVFARSFGSYSVGYIEVQTWIPQVPVVAGAVLLALAAALRLWQILRGPAA
ncbi:TRAP transporter small permease (plasmid) [Paroceanicella profunda]|uniref:TRAP transporter small permease protein n=1 Tax=Paroceanicella profunda TaxID=2579971 RepID=A0A5B8G608_9RHOB|nr:TRAP transporter small permease [Paroceanicella profunda]QDL94503.1 TRAP transporter small permease [Paroceanicella profunda]